MLKNQEPTKHFIKKIKQDAGDEKPKLQKTPDEIERPACPKCHSGDYVRIVTPIEIYEIVSPEAWDFLSRAYYMSEYAGDEFKWACIKCMIFFYYQHDDAIYDKASA